MSLTFEGAFVWGLIASSSLVIGAVIAFVVRIPLRVIGLIMGFGAGVLISAVAFDLMEEASNAAPGSGFAIAGLFLGCLVFYGGDRVIEGMGGVGVRIRPERTGADRPSRSCSEPSSTGSLNRW